MRSRAKVCRIAAAESHRANLESPLPWMYRKK